MLRRFRVLLTTAALTCAGLLGTPAASAAAAAELDPAGCRVIPVDADGPLRSAEARAVFGVDGTGVTVGVLSDSFATRVDPASTPAQDIAAGSLPGPGNPCGRTQPVVVVAEGAPGGTDEGRAMVQLVHGIAPGARLMFATAGASQFDMADHITDLADAGAQVIVDDVTEYNVPIYQQGPIDIAIAEVRARGVVYVSSAGNNNAIGAAGGPSAGLAIGSWETLNYRPADCPAALPLSEGFDCLDFDPGVGVDPTMDFGIGAGIPASHPLAGTLTWAEPWFGVEQEFRLFVLQDGVPIGESDPPGGTIATVDWSATPLVPGAAADLAIVVARKTPAPDAPLLRIAIHFFGDGLPYPTHLEYDRSTETDIVGPTAYGHNAGPDVISVAAAPYQTPTVPESYSSHGPRTLLFGPVSDVSPTPAAPLSSPQLVAAPRVMSVDGVRNTVLGFAVPDGSFAFYGTSAAAPQAAAVVALGRQLRPDAGPDELTAALVSTATPVTSPWPDVPVADVAGAGLVDAADFLGDLLLVPTAPLDVQAGPGAQPGTATVTFGAPALTGRFPISSYRVRCDSDGRTGGSIVVAGSPAVVGNLAPGAVTACSVAAVNDAGTGAPAGSAPFTMPAPTPTTSPTAGTATSPSAPPVPTAPPATVTVTVGTSSSESFPAETIVPPTTTPMPPAEPATWTPAQATEVEAMWINARTPAADGELLGAGPLAPPNGHLASTGVSTGPMAAAAAFLLVAGAALLLIDRRRRRTEL